MAVGAVDGIFLGGLSGAVGGVGNALVIQQFTESDMDELFQAMVVHSPAWLLIGLSAGAVVCAVNKSWFAVGPLLLGGAGAALLSVAMFPLISSQLFPDAHPAMRFPDTFSSLVLWIGLSNGLIALAVTRAARRPVDTVSGLA